MTRRERILTFLVIFLTFSLISVIISFAKIIRNKELLLQEREQQQEQTSFVVPHKKKKKTTTSSSYLAFNDTNPYESTTFCPHATCRHNSPICGPCNQRFIFIAATGRSASTTLLSMMNFLPNVRLSGENHGELNIASMVESNLLNRTTLNILKDKGNNAGPWRHNTIPEQSLACPIQHIFKTINPPDMKTFNVSSLFDPSMILGHKTIRMFEYSTTVQLTPKEMSDFLKRNFPCSKVIINIRSNLDTQIKSREHLQWPIDQNLKYVNQQHQEFAQWLGPDMGRLIYMEDWTSNVTVLNQVVEWLGFQDCVFDKIVHENDKGYNSDTTTTPHLGPLCRAPL